MNECTIYSEQEQILVCSGSYRDLEIPCTLPSFDLGVIPEMLTQSNNTFFWMESTHPLLHSFLKLGAVPCGLTGLYVLTKTNLITPRNKRRENE